MYKKSMIVKCSEYQNRKKNIFGTAFDIQNSMFKNYVTDQQSF